MSEHSAQQHYHRVDGCVEDCACLKMGWIGWRRIGTSSLMVGSDRVGCCVPRHGAESTPA